MKKIPAPEGSQFLNLPSKAYSRRTDENSAILTDTAVVGGKVVTETRLRDLKWVCKRFGDNGGGSQIGRGVDAETHLEGDQFHYLHAGPFGDLGYGGPQPSSGTHRYFFRLCAVDTDSDVPGGLTREELQGVIQGHILEESHEWAGTSVARKHAGRPDKTRA